MRGALCRPSHAATLDGVTRLTGESARTVRLAASLEALGTALHRIPLPAPERLSPADHGVARAHADTVREAAVAFGALADALLTDADGLYLVAARHRRAEDEAAAALDALHPPRRTGGPW